MKRKSRFKLRARNALYKAATEFKARHPDATAIDAWLHFTKMAGLSPMVAAYDVDGDALLYYANGISRKARIVRRRSFEQQWYRLNNISS